MPVRVIVLGAAGSVGRQALTVLDYYKELISIELVTLADDTDFNTNLLHSQNINNVYFYNENSQKYKDFKSVNILKSFSEVIEFCQNFSGIVINALPGLVGAKITKTLINKNIILLQANKEALVLSGDEIMKQIKRIGQTIIPLDSEMQALRKLLPLHSSGVEDFIITASGGALRDCSKEEYENASKTDILKHPTWQMGAEITVNSATLVNKVFEIIEAHYLFDINYENISVLLNSESLIHAGIRTKTNAYYFHCYKPQMVHSINESVAEALKVMPVKTSDEVNFTNITFNTKRLDFFPLYQLGLKIISQNNPSLIAAYYFTNEYLVSLFLSDKISFKQLNEIFLEVFVPENIININKISLYKSLDVKQSFIRKIVDSVIKDKEKHYGRC